MKRLRTALEKLIAIFEDMDGAARPKTLKQVNDFLARHGHEERLAKGRGYFYFHGGMAHTFSTASVMVPRLSLLSLQDWLDDLESKKQGVGQ